MGLVTYQSLGLLAVFYALYRFGERPTFISCDMRPTARIIFLYFLWSIIANKTGFTSNGGYLDSMSGYYLIVWNCTYHCFFSYLIYQSNGRYRAPVILIMSFFIELNMILFLDFFNGAPYPLLMKPDILGGGLSIYRTFAFIFNMLLLFVFILPILDLFRRGSTWLKGCLYSLLPHGLPHG